MSQTIFVVGFWTSSILPSFPRTEKNGKEHLVSTVCECVSSSVTFIQFIEIRKLKSQIITQRNIQSIQLQHCSYTMQTVASNLWWQYADAAFPKWMAGTNTKGTAMDWRYPTIAIQTILAIINVLYCHCLSYSGIPGFPTLPRA